MSVKNKFFAIRISDEMRDEIDRQSLAKGIRSMAEYARMLLERGLEAEKKQEENAS